LSGVQSLQPLRERLALDEFHDDGSYVAGFLEAVDLRDVGVIELREHLRFALEARESLGVVRERVGEDLDRDVAVELGVVGAIDLAHPAFAQQRDDLIRAELRSGAERHVTSSLSVKGLKQSMPVRATSLVFRVTSVKP
jgi:hypothetical protein